MLKHSRKQGFTLIELMIVVAIIGIIAAVAYPSYSEYVQKSRRADAMAALSLFAGAMERHFTVNSSYCGAGPSSSTDCSVGTHTGLPGVFSTESPLVGGDAYYNLRIIAVSASGFSITAAPIVGSAQAGDSCGTLTLAHTGARNAATADCWP